MTTVPGGLGLGWRGPSGFRWRAVKYVWPAAKASGLMLPRERQCGSMRYQGLEEPTLRQHFLPVSVVPLRMWPRQALLLCHNLTKPLPSQPP